MTSLAIGAFSFVPGGGTPLNAYGRPTSEQVFASIVKDGTVLGREGTMYCLKDDVEHYVCPEVEGDVEALWVNDGRVVAVDGEAFPLQDVAGECGALSKAERKAPCVFVVQKGFARDYFVDAGDPIGFVAGVQDEVAE